MQAGERPAGRVLQERPAFSYTWRPERAAKAISPGTWFYYTATAGKAQGQGKWERGKKCAPEAQKKEDRKLAAWHKARAGEGWAKPAGFAGKFRKKRSKRKLACSVGADKRT